MQLASLPRGSLQCPSSLSHLLAPHHSGRLGTDCGWVHTQHGHAGAAAVHDQAGPCMAQGQQAQGGLTKRIQCPHARQSKPACASSGRPARAVLERRQCAQAAQLRAGRVWRHTYQSRNLMHGWPGRQQAPQSPPAHPAGLGAGARGAGAGDNCRRPSIFIFGSLPRASHMEPRTTATCSSHPAPT